MTIEEGNNILNSYDQGSPNLLDQLDELFPNQHNELLPSQHDELFPIQSGDSELLNNFLLQTDLGQTDASTHQEIAWDHQKQVQPLSAPSNPMGLLDPVSSVFHQTVNPFKEEIRQQVQFLYENAKKAYDNRLDEDRTINKMNCLVALNDLKEALKVDPNYVDTHNLLGLFNLHLGQYYSSEYIKLKNAYPDVDEKSTDPETIEVMKYLNDHDARCYQYCFAAIKCFEEAVRLKGSLKLDAYRHIAHCHYTMHSFERALEIYTELLSIDPLNEKLYLSRGKFFYAMGKYRQAALDFEQLKSNNKYKGSVFHLLTQSYLKLGDVANVKKHLSVSLQAFWKAYELKNIYIMKNIAKQFLQYDVEKYFPEKYFIIGLTFMYTRKDDDAIKYFEDFFDWHLSNPNSEHKCEDNKINKVMQFYLELHKKK